MLIDMDYIAFDNKGSKVGKMRMNNVNFIGSSNYDPFSLTTLLKSEWTIQGNPEKVVTKNDTQTVTFAIKTKTPNGALYWAL